MFIQSIAVQGLHRAIDAKLNFHPDLGIIVGINGSGKTSIINLTSHLLRLNVPELLRISFEDIEIVGKDGRSKTISIKAIKLDGELQIIAKRSGRRVAFFACPSPAQLDMADRPEERAAWERYLRRTTSEIAATKLASFIRANVRLTLVKLDRTLFAEDYTGAVAIDPGLPQRTLRRMADESEPIEQVERATRNKFTEYQSQLKLLNVDLTNKLVLQLFQVTDVFNSRQSRATALTDPKKIIKLEQSIKASSFYPKHDADKAAIASYFRITKQLAREFDKDLSKAELKSNVWQQRFFTSARERFIRLNMLAKEFNEFDKRASDAFKELEAYLSAINSFLAESQKVAFFSEQDNTLRFKIIGESNDDGRPISELSSGEKQIVTVLAYLAYEAGNNSIFLIDEPELSLHISWQAGLLKALQSVQPLGCQLIMATHSPEIVGDKRDRVVKLIPRYRKSSR